MSRRAFVGLASAAAVGLVGRGAVGHAWGAAAGLPPGDRRHVLALRLPVVTTNGAKVPIVVEMPHPMAPDHYIRTIHVVNERDPVPSKGVFHFTPANGEAYLAFQARMHEGRSEVSATAECSVHGLHTIRRSINIPAGAGGCAAPAPVGQRTVGADIAPPRIRIPQLVEHGRIRPDEIIDVQVMMRHPNRTGLVVREGTFVQESEPFHLREMELLYGGERVSRFVLTAALSDDPFITLRLRARAEERLQIVLANTRGQRFEATHHIRFG